MQLIDTHTHLNLGDYAEDQQHVIETALVQGISRMILPGVTYESCLSAIELCEAYPGVLYFALGVHPCDVHKDTGWSAEVRQKLSVFTQHPAFVAIGETGLDYYWDEEFIPVQHQALREQIHWAQALNKPIILHVRDKADSTRAYDDLIRILHEEKAQSVGGVMHCFSGDLAFARASIELGFYLAYGGVTTFKKAHSLHEVVREISLEHIVLETDSPWLAPVPYRGKRNQPAYVAYVAQRVAELKQIPLEEVAIQTTANAQNLFFKT